MFQGCTALTSLDISNFDASSLQYAYHMFSSCNHLSTVTIGSKWKWLSDQDAYLPVTSIHPKWYASDGTGYLPKDVPIPATGTATYTQNPPAQAAAQDANNPATADPSAAMASVPQGAEATAASSGGSGAASSKNAVGTAPAGTQGTDSAAVPAAKKEQAVVEGSAGEGDAPSVSTQSAAAGGKPLDNHAE